MILQIAPCPRLGRQELLVEVKAMPLPEQQSEQISKYIDSYEIHDHLPIEFGRLCINVEVFSVFQEFLGLICDYTVEAASDAPVHVLFAVDCP